MYNESQKFINFNATTTKRKKKKKSIKFKDRVIMFVIYKEDKPRILESGQDEESKSLESDASVVDRSAIASDISSPTNDVYKRSPLFHPSQPPPPSLPLVALSLDICSPLSARAS